MVDIIIDGWLWVTNGSDYLKLGTEEILWDIMVDPKIEHYYGGAHLGYDLEKKWLVLKVIGIKIKSHANYASIVSNLMAWQVAGSMILSVVRNTSNNKITFDGSNSNYPVLIKKPGLKQMQKVSPDNQDRYRIETLTFEQTGTAT